MPGSFSVQIILRRVTKPSIEFDIPPLTAFATKNQVYTQGEGYAEGAR
jgi:hypothetical protein